MLSPCLAPPHFSPRARRNVPLGRSLVTLLTLSCCLALSACSKSKAAAGQPSITTANAPAERSETLVVARAQGANSLDIHGVGTNNPAYEVSWNVYDRLISYGDKTAHDVRWSFERALAMGGFPKFQMNAGSIEKPEQFVVIDDHTFKLELLRKDKFTLPDLSVPVAAIYNSKLAKQHATPADPWAAEWLKMNTAASGAFRVEAFEPGVSLPGPERRLEERSMCSAGSPRRWGGCRFS